MESHPHLVFLHGMYMNPVSWAPWVERASTRGYTCHTPAWPHHDGEPATLRRNIAPALGSLKFGEVTEHTKAVIDALPERPLLIGHSIGGLLVQKLVNDGYAQAGVAVSPAPPKGVRTFDPTFLRANFPHVNPLAGNRPVQMTKKRFHFTFCNTMSRADSDEAFEKYVVPESRNVPRSTQGRQGEVDFDAEHKPMLFLAGDQDHLVPMGLVEKNVAAYASGAGTLDFKQFDGRSHFICNQPGWESVADYALDWLDKL